MGACIKLFSRLQRLIKNPLDALLEQAQEKQQERFLICWNRGLGDIALGLYALVWRIRQFIPNAQIVFLTRQDLKEGFELLAGVEVRVDPRWKRGEKICLDDQVIAREAFDVVMEWPDPTAWLKWQLGTLVPRLQWKPQWDHLLSLQAGGLAGGLAKKYIAAHVETQTHYGYEKNWPLKKWRELFDRIPKEYTLVILGAPSSVVFTGDNILDWRGKTSLLQLLSWLKTECSYLVVPDSGILSMIYYLDQSFPLRVVSLWADPHQGVLKQGVKSPNPQLVHVPLVANNGQLDQLAVSKVLDALFT